MIHQAIVTLFKRLKRLNCDPLHQNRFGAALAFNNVYQVPREEASIVDQYWLDSLLNFCINFKVSEQYLEENVSCQTNLDQISASLDHILRVLKEQKRISNTPSASRMKPIPFQNALLMDAVLWLIDQLQSVQHKYRAKVMDLFIQLAPCVDGYNSAANFMRNTQTAESLIELCEHGITEDPFDEIPLCFSKVLTWLMRFQAALDCYTWCIANDFLSKHSLNAGTCTVFKAIQKFMDAMDLHFFLRFKDIIKMENFNAAKSKILQNIFKFLITAMPMGCVACSIWVSETLIVIIEKAVFRPQFLDCDVRDSIYVNSLFEIVESFVVTANRFAPNTFRITLNDQLAVDCSGNFKSLVENVKYLINRTSIAKDRLSPTKGVESIYRLVKMKKDPAHTDIERDVDRCVGKRRNL